MTNDAFGKLITIVEILVVTIVPVFLIEIGVFPKSSRIQLYAVAYSLAIPIVLIHRISLKELSIRMDNFADAARYFGPQVILLVVGGFILAFVVKFRIHAGVGREISPWQYLLVSVPMQQLIFFGFLHAQLTRITSNKPVMVVVIAASFAASHLPWDNQTFTLITLGMGTVWGSLFVMTPSLPWSLISHLLIGVFSLVIVQLK